MTNPLDAVPGDPVDSYDWTVDDVVDETSSEECGVVRELRLPCANEECAEAMLAELVVQQVDAVIDGRYVVVPTGGHPGFVYDLAQLAVDLEYAHDDEAARAVSNFLEAACAGCDWDGTGPHCHLCHEPVFSLDHMRAVHPEVRLQRWPDGGVVVVDATLDSGGFCGP